MAIDIDVTAWPRVTVVAPKGDLDMAVADELRRTLTALIDGKQTQLVIDLAQVLYIDSSGLGALVAAMKHARGAGGDIHGHPPLAPGGPRRVGLTVNARVVTV